IISPAPLCTLSLHDALPISAATDVAKPCEPPALLIVATAVLDELQVTWVVRSCVVLSLKVPVAVNCWVNPSGRPGLVGVTAIETRVALVTVSVAQVFVVVQLALPSVAVIVMGPPAATDVARPSEPLALLIVAEPVLDDLQVTWGVRSCVVLSVWVAVAVNCRVVPFAMLGFVGVTAIEERVAFVTVSVVFPETSPSVAVIVVVPAATDVARPALSIVATPVFDELQATWAVKSCVLLSE